MSLPKVVAFWWSVSLLVFLSLQTVVLNPMLQSQAQALGQVSVGQNQTVNATGFNQSATVTLPVFGTLNFADPLTLGATLLVVFAAIGIAVGAAGFVTSGASKNAIAMGAFVGTIIGLALLGLALIFPVFALIPVLGVPVFGVYGLVGLLAVAFTGFDLLAGG